MSSITKAIIDNWSRYALKLARALFVFERLSLSSVKSTKYCFAYFSQFIPSSNIYKWETSGPNGCWNYGMKEKDIVYNGRKYKRAWTEQPKEE